MNDLWKSGPQLHRHSSTVNWSWLTVQRNEWDFIEQYFFYVIHLVIADPLYLGQVTSASLSPLSRDMAIRCDMGSPRDHRHRRFTASELNPRSIKLSALILINCHRGDEIRLSLEIVTASSDERRLSNRKNVRTSWIRNNWIRRVGDFPPTIIPCVGAWRINCEFKRVTITLVYVGS